MAVNRFSEQSPCSEKRKENLMDKSPSRDNIWVGMPEYNYETNRYQHNITFYFDTEEDIQYFEELIGRSIKGRKSICFKRDNITQNNNSKPKEKAKNDGIVAYTHNELMSPKYPIYIVSKGRASCPKTANALDRMKCPYRIVIEPQEYDEYLESIKDPDKILTLPFRDLGQGSIPARNWIWEHSLEEGHKRHWILDDNISNFYRANNNRQIIANTPNVIRAAEEFVDRYENIGLAGFHYSAFVPQTSNKYIKPYILNTRIYSMILIDNNLDFRWRGRYNEDTDLSLRVLKKGLCTILFRAFLIDKAKTMTMKGGNTDELYEGDGRLKMAQSLQEQHPDVCTITHKWGRHQHHVNYIPFQNNELILKKNAKFSEDDNEFGMVLGTIGRKVNRGKGYGYSKKKDRWIARVHVNGKEKYVGSFKTEEEAKNAVNEARTKIDR
jgi:hypothetical protein